MRRRAPVETGTRREQRYRQALEITPVFFEAMGYLGFIAAQRGDEAGAMAWYAKATAADPGFPHVYCRIGDLYFEPGDYARALEAYRRVLASLPDHFEALTRPATAPATAATRRARRTTTRAPGPCGRIRGSRLTISPV
jgi:tetratricopeptide (TPR) repeat protein